MSFSHIKGHDNQVQMMREYIRQSRMAHGHLFLGPEGVGKKLFALTLAKALNCLSQTLDSCDTCESCRKIEKGQHPDVHLISADSEDIKIDAVRQLQREIHLMAYEGKEKIFIIDNAHYLTAEAANALLKVLEEPPQNSLIILISSKPALLFKTIISRCRIIKFYALQKDLLQDVLIRDCGMDKDISHFLSYYCEGRIGKALEMKEQDIVGRKNRVIDQFLFNPQFSLDLRDRDSVCDYLNILATWFRDMYVAKVQVADSALINLDRKDDVRRCADAYSMHEIDGVMSTLSEALLYVEHNVNVKLIIAHLRSVLKRPAAVVPM